MNKSVILSLLLVSILVFACGKSSNSKKIVRNASSKVIRLSVFDKRYSGNERQSFTIESNHEVVIENLTSKSGPMYASSENCVFSNYDSVVIIVQNDNNVKIVKDLTNSNSWTFSKTSNSKEIDVVCKATITDTDIVPK